MHRQIEMKFHGKIFVVTFETAWIECGTFNLISINCHCQYNRDKMCAEEFQLAARVRAMNACGVREAENSGQTFIYDKYMYLFFSRTIRSIRLSILRF